MSFLRAWLAGYGSPARFAERLRDLPAPRGGFFAQLLRAMLDALLLYLPLYLLGRVPPTPSWLPFLPTRSYYGSLIWLTPLVLGAQWLIGGAALHVVLRLAGRPSDIDRILNISGVVALVIGAFLLLWDWTWMGLGGMNQVVLGISHLVVDIWGIVLTTTALRRLLGVPAWLGVLLNLLLVVLAMPFAIMFMRSPL